MLACACQKVGKDAKNVPGRWKIQQCSVYFKDVLIFLFWREISTVYSWQEQIKGPNFSPNTQLGLSLFFLFSVLIQPWLGQHRRVQKCTSIFFLSVHFFRKLLQFAKFFIGETVGCCHCCSLCSSMGIQGHHSSSRNFVTVTFSLFPSSFNSLYWPLRNLIIS